MIDHEYKFKADVWLYPGLAAWHFVTLPKELSHKIKTLYGDMKRGWGSLPVNVTVGDSKWKTSIFPDSKRGAYILPIKASVRKIQKIVVGKEIKILIQIII